MLYNAFHSINQEMPSLSFLCINVSCIIDSLLAFSLDKARSYIRGSNVDFFSSIVQEKKFIDTVKNLTIFIEEKNKNGDLKNIILKENLKKNNYQIILAKRGKVKKTIDGNSLVLFDGKIINNTNKETNSIKFAKTEINLSRFSTKTITHPKIQEITTYDIIACIHRLKNLPDNFIFNFFKTEKKLTNCREETQTAPVTTIIVSEISIKYATVNFFQNFYIYALPVVFFILIYLYFVITLKKNNLVNQ